MANIGKIYSDAISLTPQEREEKGFKPKLEVDANPISPAEDAASGQATLDWLSSPVTSALLKDLGNQVEEALDEAIKLSVGFSSHQNPWRIIQLLNKANDMRVLIRKYGRRKPSTLN